MLQLVRKVVAGPKHTTVYNGQQLDLTYITPTVIAMAYPASELLEKTYRNPIELVAEYLYATHQGHYLVLNCSGREYDPAPFGGRVKHYPWVDHQAPPLALLVQIAHDMVSHLSKDDKNVVAVHCNHGKGRTGTAIVSLLLLLQSYSTAREALTFYNNRRFSKDSYGVDQPCQLRYLHYFQRLVSSPEISPKLVCYRLKGATFKGQLTQEQYWLTVKETRSQEVVHERVKFNRRIKQASTLLFTDILVELFQEQWKGAKRIARANLNLYFLQPATTKLRLRGDQLKVSKGHSQDFQITLHFQYYCLCHLPAYKDSYCHCRRERAVEEMYWQQMARQIAKDKSMRNREKARCLGGQISGVSSDEEEEEEGKPRNRKEELMRRRRQKYCKEMKQTCQQRQLKMEQQQMKFKESLSAATIEHKNSLSAATIELKNSPPFSSSQSSSEMQLPQPFIDILLPNPSKEEEQDNDPL